MSTILRISAHGTALAVLVAGTHALGTVHLGPEVDAHGSWRVPPAVDAEGAS